MPFKQIIAATMALAALALVGCTAPASGVAISGAWSPPSPNGASVGAGYLTITNTGDQADRLTAASSPRAEHVEIHEMTMDGAMMQMKRVDTLYVPAKGKVELAPNGMHFMLIGLKAPLIAGEDVPVTLQFERAGQVEVHLAVKQAP